MDTQVDITQRIWPSERKIYGIQTQKKKVNGNFFFFILQ